jgi:CDP-4-dehydro-6-deoxyglucose reductase, E3
MAEVVFEGQALARNAGESVLDCLLRHGKSVPYSCKAGACHTCIMQASGGEVPVKSQSGLKETLAARKFFLSCVCFPEGDLSVAAPGDELNIPAEITGIDDLGAGVLRVQVRCAKPLGHRAGQYISLVREDGLARSYSIASRAEEGALELHVRVIPNGAMSLWLRDAARPGTKVRVQGPSGDCFYVPGRGDQRLILAGTGTGLAPLYGIVKDALAHGHDGPIALYHGARAPDGLYLMDELRTLASWHANFTYNPCTLNGISNGILTGALDALLVDREKNLKDARVFLCGDPALVMGLRKKLFLAGASYKQIFADAFLPSAK